MNKEINGLLNKEFIISFNEMSDRVHNNAISHGLWEKERNDAEMICLMHSELSEALEYLRHDNGASDHISEFSGLEEELADTIIRIMDFAYSKKLRVAEAIIAKHQFNTKRPYKHGKKF